MSEMGQENGIVRVRSPRSVAETVARIEQWLTDRNVTIFARVDHAGEAEKVGLTMRPTVLLIFGNPKAGTPLMLAAPTMAIDLPLKILVWEDADQAVWIAYNGADYLLRRHHAPADLRSTVAIVATIAAAAAGE